MGAWNLGVSDEKGLEKIMNELWKRQQASQLFVHE